MKINDRIGLGGYGYTLGCAQVLDDLAPRHREVVALLAEGLGNAEIADRLFIQPQTVRNHVVAIYEAIGVPTSRFRSGQRVLAARWVWEQEHE